MMNTLQVETKKSGKQVQLYFNGDLTYDYISDVHGDIVKALEKAGKIFLHLDGIDKFDLIGVQLLCSIRKYADKKGIPLEYEGEKFLPRLKRFQEFSGMSDCVLEENNSSGAS